MPSNCSFPLLLEYFSPHRGTWSISFLLYLWSLRKLWHNCAILTILLLFLPAWLGDRSRIRIVAVFLSLGIMNLIGSFLVFPAFFLQLFYAGMVNKFIGSCSYLLTQIMGIEMEFRSNYDMNKESKGVIILNHMSILDSLVACYHVEVFGDWVVAVKKEFKWFGTYGLAMRFMNGIFIDRSSKYAMQELSTACKRLFAMPNKVCRLILFPEGTRNKSQDGHLLPFKLGAFRIAVENNVPIFPMVISKYYFREGSQIFSRGTVVLKALEPIRISSDEDLTIVAKRTREIMLKEFIELSNEVRRIHGQKQRNSVRTGLVFAVAAIALIYLVRRTLEFAEYINCDEEYFNNKYE